MKNKPKRLGAIRRIVAGERVGSQEELLQKLREQGFELTQATLSRDLKQLKVAKTATADGEYAYVLPAGTSFAGIANAHAPGSAPVRDGVVWVKFSGNIAVIKTRPGYASGIALDIDMHNLPSVLGTVAGDDTVILVIKEGYSHKWVYQQLGNIVPGIEEEEFIVRS